MNTLNDTARSASFHDGFIIVSMESGAEIRFAVVDNPRLAKGTAKQLDNIEISPFGLHWPELDEDLSFRGLCSRRPRPGREADSAALKVWHVGGS